MTTEPTILEGLTAELLDGPQLLENARESLRGAGKTQQEIAIFKTRELTPDDVEQVGKAEVGTSTTPPLQKLRSSHHRLAQLLAKGYKEVDAARITGYSQSRISILKNDPAFKNLLAQYKDHVEEAFADTIEKMKHVVDDSLDLLHERILDEPASLGIGALTDIVTKIGDRAGYAPVQKSVTMNLPVDAETLAAMKDKVKGRANGQVRTIQQTAVEGTYTVVQGNQEPSVGETGGSSGEVCGAPEVQGSAGEGVLLRTVGGEAAQVPN